MTKEECIKNITVQTTLLKFEIENLLNQLDIDNSYSVPEADKYLRKSFDKLDECEFYAIKAVKRLSVKP